MTGKKKTVDFRVRPRAGQEELPPTPEQWVKEGEGADARPAKEKRLTLNLPANLHTAFKSRCVLKDVTIQERVTFLIERDVAEGAARGRRQIGPGLTTLPIRSSFRRLTPKGKKGRGRASSSANDSSSPVPPIPACFFTVWR